MSKVSFCCLLCLIESAKVSRTFATP